MVAGLYIWEIAMLLVWRWGVPIILGMIFYTLVDAANNWPIHSFGFNRYTILTFAAWVVACAAGDFIRSTR